MICKCCDSNFCLRKKFLVRDLQVKIPGLERETSAQGTTHGNADISDNSEII